MIVATRLFSNRGAISSLSSSTAGISKRSIYIPRVTERRAGEGGPGGRHSDAGVKVAVFGSGGFLGNYLCYNNGTNGVKTYIGNRGDEFEQRHLNPMFDLGMLRKVFYSSRDRDSMANVIGDADVVVNLIGKYYETKHLTPTPKFPYLSYEVNTTFQEANVDVPRTVAELCTEMQVDNLIHVSALAANPESKSEWARTKHEGEVAVKEAYPWATIVRPAVMFGHEDKLLNWFANAASRLPFVPLVNGGQALTQPVYVSDVADVISRIIDDPSNFEGRTVEVFGKDDFTYKELSQFVYDITGQSPTVVDLPPELMKPMARILELQGSPMLTRDLVDLWNEDNVQSRSDEEYEAIKGEDAILTLKDFGIDAVRIEKIAFEYLHRFRDGGHFELVDGGYHGKDTKG
mmetsp:Transcript_26349/g.39059  ORF Transcript_26349/g.39059 Transcript_26349/m.39059 type:complete len:403 (+) Transcript_26349:124-1332(+)